MEVPPYFDQFLQDLRNSHEHNVYLTNLRNAENMQIETLHYDRLIENARDVVQEYINKARDVKNIIPILRGHTHSRGQRQPTQRSNSSARGAAEIPNIQGIHRVVTHQVQQRKSRKRRKNSKSRRRRKRS